jgi:hypothetical protein
MRTSSFVVALGLSLTLGGSAYWAQAAPLFVNGVVVAADLPRARITIERTDGKVIALPVEGDARSMLGALSRGDRVILGGRETVDGRTLVAVTEIQKGRVPAGAPAGTPGRGTTRPQVLRPGQNSAGSVGRNSTGSVERERVESRADVRSPVVVADVRSPVVVVETVPSTSIPLAPPGAVPLEIVNNPIPSVPRREASVDVIVPPSVVPPGAEAASEVERARAARDFDAAVSALAVKANDLDRRWEGYRQLCPAGPTQASAAEARGWVRVLRGEEPAPTDDGCRRNLAELSDLATQFQRQLAGVADNARRAGVLPGRMRDSLTRANLDSLS